MKKIIVAGSINMDVVVQSPRLPRPGETLFGTELHYLPGGKGSNQAVAANRIGGGVQLVGKLGRDGFGQSMADFLKNENMGLDYLTYSEDAPTGIALITVDDESENTIIVVSGSNYAMTPEDVAQVPLSGQEILISQFEIPQEVVLALFTRANAAGATTMMNLAPATDFIPGLHETVDYLIVNETELGYYIGEEVGLEVDDASLARLAVQARKLQARPDQTIIVTLGSKGSFCVQGDEMHYVKGLRVRAVDTTGAGDCFVGALAVALAEEQHMEQALREYH